MKDNEYLQNVISNSNLTKLTTSDSPSQKSAKANNIISKQTFVYDFVTYLKDSNAYGNNYFARYFEWQGICREAWFYNCISEDFLQPLGIFITKSAHSEYKRETFPFQKIRCFVNTSNIGNASFYLNFSFCDPEDKNIVFAEGYQQIVFANKNRKITRLPLVILNKVKEYCITN